METGGYLTPQDVVARALEMLNHEERWLYENRQAAHAKIERGIAQCEQGKFFSEDESCIDEEFHALFLSLAELPGQGHKRSDITSSPVLFFLCIPIS